MAEHFAQNEYYARRAAWARYLRESGGFSYRRIGEIIEPLTPVAPSQVSAMCNSLISSTCRIDGFIATYNVDPGNVELTRHKLERFFEVPMTSIVVL